MRQRLRRLLLIGVGVLYVLSVPWYREPGGASGVLFGLPDWVAVAIGCYVGAAVLNALAWLMTDIDEGGT
ncbi:MAG: hypothetical protein VX546_10800 [Myxococcota bacterium]|nr:hypothetical protein [Myxococcota bacterium]